MTNSTQESRDKKVHFIIHGASAAAAAVGAGMAQIPGSDAVPIGGIQVGMITSIAAVHEVQLDKATATHLLATFVARQAATVAGRTASQWIGGWVPGYGNAVNAATAAAITEAVGWMANSYFEDPSS